MDIQECCVRGFEWEGTPEGKVIPFPTESNQAYVTGSQADVAILLIHDLLSWNFRNTRLLADHYAREVGATVYLPDFFAGKTLPEAEILDDSVFRSPKLPAFHEHIHREKREPEILACARHLRSRYKKVAAIGFCFGGWAVFRLGAEEFNPRPYDPSDSADAQGRQNLVDCITAGHPTWLTKSDIDHVAVPVQVLAPEIDPVYNAELKRYTFDVVPTRDVPFEYRHFPGVEHACFTRGDPKRAREREALIEGKRAAVAWIKGWLHPTE